MRAIYSNTHNKDMFYAVKADIPDSFFFIDTGAKKYVFLDMREIGAFLEKNKDDLLEAVPLEPILEEVDDINIKASPSEKLAFYIFKNYTDGKEVEVPISFPLNIADFLRKKGVNIVPVDPFYPQRAVKSEEEKEFIKKNIEKTCFAFRRVEEILKESSIKGNKVIYKGVPLTSEFLKMETEKILLSLNMENPEGVVISCGRQSSFPHHRGEGEILPHSSIICDIFPRNRGNGYFADMTRTYVKGTPSAELKKMYKVVLIAQETALKFIGPNIPAAHIHEKVCSVFEKEGYKELFVHGTGHGLGLDVHEGPYLRARSEDLLCPGNVVTVEPGLYKESCGGVRIEDVVYINKDGAENLTNYPKEIIIS